jgi:hypothetical protein
MKFAQTHHDCTAKSVKTGASCFIYSARLMTDVYEVLKSPKPVSEEAAFQGNLYIDMRSMPEINLKQINKKIEFKKTNHNFTTGTLYFINGNLDTTIQGLSDLVQIGGLTKFIWITESSNISKITELINSHLTEPTEFQNEMIRFGLKEYLN